MIRRIAAAAMFAWAVGCGAVAAATDEHSRVQKAEAILAKILSDPENETLRGMLRKARGILIVPSYVQAGIFVGGTSGGGVMLVRRAGGGWNGPAFFDTASGTLGPQFGVISSELVLLFMSDRSVSRALQGALKFGADALVAAGPSGEGVRESGADIYSYMKPRGAYVGATVSTGAIEPDRGENEEYYGRGASAHSILIEGRFNTERGLALRNLLAKY